MFHIKTDMIPIWTFGIWRCSNLLLVCIDVVRPSVRLFDVYILSQHLNVPPF